MTNQSLRVLLVEDSLNDATLTLRQLERAGYKLHAKRVETSAEMTQALQTQVWDLVLCDFQLPEFNAPAALTVLKRTNLDIPFIVVSGSIGEENAVIMMRVGAHDYLMKDNMARLVPAVSRELAEAQNRKERRRAQAALLESEERWKFALDCAGDGVWDWDLSRGEATYSRRWKEMLGYDEQDVGTTIIEWSKLVCPDDLTHVMSVLHQHLDGETPQYVCEMRMVCKDGSLRWVLSRGQVISRDPSGQALRVVGTQTDIADRKEAEARKQENDERFKRQAQIQEAILDALPANIVLLDSSGVIIEANEAWQDFSTSSFFHQHPYGVGDNYLGACASAQEPLSKHAFEAAEGIRHVLAGQTGSFAMEYSVATPQGMQWIRLLATPLHEERLDGAVVSHVDITQLVLAEEGRRKREKLEHSLKLAKQVQRSLLPAADPIIKGLDVVGRSTYCDATGGDYYDFLDVKPTSPGTLLTAVGDVSGHGIAAALLMATARAVLHSQYEQVDSLPTLMTKINTVLSKDSRHERFMTLLLALIDPKVGSLHWVSAGHDPPFVFHARTQDCQELRETDLVLGVDPEVTFTQHSLTGLVPGDIVFIGTDGIWEMHNAKGKQFGRQGLKDFICEHQHLSAVQIAQALDDRLAAYLGEAPVMDDVTYVVVKILPVE